MERTRVLLLSMPTMLRELVLSMVQPDDAAIEVVGEVGDPDRLVEASAATRADAVLVALPRPELPAACRRLLVERPDMHVVGLVEHGRRGVRWELRAIPLGELTPDRLRVALAGRAEREGDRAEGQGNA